MPSPGELSHQIPTPLAKARMQKPQGGANVWWKVEIPEMSGGGGGGDRYG